MTHTVIIVLANLFFLVNGFLAGRHLKRKPKRLKHEHLWEEWEVTTITIYNPTVNKSYQIDVQQHKCLGCGYLQREKILV